MTEMNQGNAWSSRLAQGLALLAIFLLAVELRLLFQTGVADIDALVYVHLARNLADGIFRLTYEGLPSSATIRLGLYGPVAALYRLFGTSDVTTLAWPFACSILGIGFAYGIGRKLAGEAAGLMSAFLWAVLPTGVAAATALMGDGPIAGLSLGVVYFLLVAESLSGIRFAAALAASLLCLLVGLGNKPAILLIGAFLVVYPVWKWPRRWLAWVGVAAALASVVAGYVFFLTRVLYLGRANWSAHWFWATLVPSMRALPAYSTDWWAHLVLGNPEFSWIAPLWIVAIAALLALRRRDASLPVLWFATMFFCLQFGSRSLTSYQPITTASLGNGTARHFLLVAAPAMIVSGIYLAQALRPVTARWLVAAVAAAIGTVAWAGTRHATNLDWGITGETMLPFELKSALAIAVTIYGAIASPLFTAGEPRKWKTLGVALLACAIGVASLNLSYRAAAVNRAVWLTTMPEAVPFLERNPSLPVLVQNDVFGERLDYSSHFELGFNSVLRKAGPRARIAVAPKDAANVRDAYVLIDEYYVKVSPDVLWGAGPPYFKAPPVNWAEITRFGDRAGYRLRVYRAPGAEPVRELDAARAAVHAARTAETLRRLLAAGTNAGAYCDAASAWQALRPLDPAFVKDFDPIRLIRECVTTRPDLRGPNRFQNGDFTQGRELWTLHPESNATVTIEPDRTWHVKYRGGNWQVISQEVAVRPDTAYVYEADIKTTAPVVSLYWQTDIGRFLDLSSTYLDWTHLHYVFITPHAVGNTTGFSPILMQAPGEAWLRNLRLSEVRLPPVQ
jgi:hypothetical protein